MKYELTKNTKNGLFQIRALKDFAGVKSGDLGGWIESEKNLSQDGSCWVYGNAMVYENAKVFGDAKVCGNAWVYENAKVFGDAKVCGTAKVSGNAEISGIRRSDGYTFILVDCADGIKRIQAGCRNFALEEAKEHWTKTRGGTKLGEETMDIISFLEKWS